jgi:DNA-binding transcriptional ArsR family regulator
MEMKLNKMTAAAGRASEFLKMLGHPHRLLILCQLLDGERSVGELAGLLGVRESTASQHLALLRRDGLVAGRRDGQTIWYSITSQPARRVLETVYEFFCARGDEAPRTGELSAADKG